MIYMSKSKLELLAALLLMEFKDGVFKKMPYNVCAACHCTYASIMLDKSKVQLHFVATSCKL